MSSTSSVHSSGHDRNPFARLLDALFRGRSQIDSSALAVVECLECARERPGVASPSTASGIRSNPRRPREDIPTCRSDAAKLDQH